MTSLLEQHRGISPYYGFENNRMLEVQGDPAVLHRMAAEFQLPRDFEDFYAHCGGLNWSEIYNGYFVFPFEEILNRHASGDVTVIEAEPAIPILVIGGNGGGGRFAVKTDGSEQVLYLPSGGGVTGTAWAGDSMNLPEVIAGSFEEFLQALLNDLRAAATQTTNWKYISSH